MKRDKVLSGETVVVEATGVVLLGSRLPRPTREHAASTSAQLDPTRGYFTMAGYSKLSATVHVADGPATMSLQVTNGDPEDADTPWHTVDSSAALDDTSDHLSAVDVVALYGRLRWASGTPAATITATVYAA